MLLPILVNCNLFRIFHKCKLIFSKRLRCSQNFALQKIIINARSVVENRSSSKVHSVLPQAISISRIVVITTSPSGRNSSANGICTTSCPMTSLCSTLFRFTALVSCAFLGFSTIFWAFDWRIFVGIFWFTAFVLALWTRCSVC